MNAVSGSRNVAIDQSKSVAMISVVTLHAALAYVGASTYGWIVNDSGSSLFFAALARILDIFPMPAFFYFAGFLFARSAQTKDFHAYAARRAARLLPPFVLGLLVLNPIAQYAGLLDSGKAQGFFHFLFQDYFQGGMTSYHLWFLLVLFVFQVVLFYPVKQRRLEPLRHKAVLLVAGVLLMTLLSRLLGDKSWITFIQEGVIRFEPARCIAYLTFFLLGVQGSIKSEGTLKDMAVSIAAFSIMNTVELLFSQAYYGHTSASLLLSFADCALYFALAYSYLSMSLLFFQRLPVPFLIAAARCSYGVYIVHFAIVVVLQHLLHPAPVNIYLKFAVVLSGSLALSVLLTMLSQKLMARLRA
jgi:surface polysaccharide O-acyltransferase-like enzyme